MEIVIFWQILSLPQFHYIGSVFFLLLLRRYRLVVVAAAAQSLIHLFSFIQLCYPRRSLCFFIAVDTCTTLTIL